MALKSELVGSELGIYSATPNIMRKRRKDVRRKRRLRFIIFRFVWQRIGLNRESSLSGMDTIDTNTKIHPGHAGKNKQFELSSSFFYRCEQHAIRSIFCQQLDFLHRG